MIRTFYPPGLVVGFLGFSFLWLTGCSNSRPTYELSGTVSYQGKPVPKGHINLSPGDGNTGLGATAEIADGKFRTTSGKGHTGGKYKLQVFGYDGIPVKSGEGGEDPNGKQLFPPHVIIVDLPTEAKNDLVIDIKKQGTE